MRIAPAVFLALALLGCKDRAEEDFTRVWASYHPQRVAGAETPVPGR